MHVRNGRAGRLFAGIAGSFFSAPRYLISPWSFTTFMMALLALTMVN